MSTPFPIAKENSAFVFSLEKKPCHQEKEVDLCNKKKESWGWKTGGKLQGQCVKREFWEKDTLASTNLGKCISDYFFRIDSPK